MEFKPWRRPRGDGLSSWCRECVRRHTSRGAAKRRPPIPTSWREFLTRVLPGLSGRSAGETAEGVLEDPDVPLDLLAKGSARRMGHLLRRLQAEGLPLVRRRIHGRSVWTWIR